MTVPLAPPKKKPSVFLNIIAVIIGVCFLCVVFGVINELMSPSSPTGMPNLSPTSANQTSTQPVIGKTLDEYLQEYGGNRDVYIRILSLTDCSALQEEFNIASANNGRETPGTQEFKWTVGYMQAAQDQMTYRGCY